VELVGYSATTYNTIKKWKAACVQVEGGREILYPTRRPEDIGVVVAGGDSGPHSAVLGTFNGTRLVTRPVARADGTPVRSVHDFLQ
jgi:hypothetical protein